MNNSISIFRYSPYNLKSYANKFKKNKSLFKDYDEKKINELSQNSFKLVKDGSENFNEDCIKGKSLSTNQSSKIIPYKQMSNTLIKGSLNFSNGDLYHGEMIDQIPNGKGIMEISSDKSILKGRWLNGLLEGLGCIYYYDGSKLEAFFINGILNGHSQLVFPNQDIVYANYFNGIKHGKACIHYKNGKICEENWINGIREGEATLTIKEDKTIKMNWIGGVLDSIFEIFYVENFCIYFKGECLNELPHGFGKMHYADGSIYEGNWSNGFLHGNGKYILASGKVIYSNWINGKIGVEGKIESSNGDKYTGGIFNYEPHGYGKIKYSDGSSFEGRWLEGLCHGEGCFIFPSGEIINGIWENGIIKKEFTLPDSFEFRDKIFYKTKDEDSFMVAKDNSLIRGSWKSKRLEGETIIKYPNKDIFEGTWQNGVINGISKTKKSDNAIVYEIWDNGHLKPTVNVFYPNGDRYTGECLYLENSCLHRFPNGKGKMFYANGSILEGIWKTGKCILQQNLNIESPLEEPFIIIDSKERNEITEGVVDSIWLENLVSNNSENEFDFKNATQDTDPKAQKTLNSSFDALFNDFLAT